MCTQRRLGPANPVSTPEGAPSKLPLGGDVRSSQNAQRFEGGWPPLALELSSRNAHSACILGCPILDVLCQGWDPARRHGPLLQSSVNGNALRLAKPPDPHIALPEEIDSTDSINQR